MSSYKKILGWAGPIVLPLVITGLRQLFRRKKNSGESNAEDGKASGRKVLDTLVDAGLSSVTRGMRGSRKG